MHNLHKKQKEILEGKIFPQKKLEEFYNKKDKKRGKNIKKF